MHNKRVDGIATTGSVFYIERLTVWVFIFFVLPYVIRKKLKEHCRNHTGYFIDASSIGLLVARYVLPVFSARVERLNFRLIDIIDEAGISLRLRIEIQDLVEVQKSIVNDARFKKALLPYSTDPFFYAYLKKELVSIDLHGDTMGRVIFLIQVVVWKNRMCTQPQESTVFFMYRRVFMSVIHGYAQKYNVLVLPASRMSLRPMKMVGLIFGLRMIRLKNIYYDLRMRGIISALKRFFLPPKASDFVRKNDQSPRLVVEYSGNLNLKNSELYSDLFFLKQSKFVGKDAVLTFSMPADPLDEAKYNECIEEGITPAVIDPRATTLPFPPVFYPNPSATSRRPKNFLFNYNGEERYVAENFEKYSIDSDYWYYFCRRYGIKLFLTWYKYNGKHISIANALRRIGGVSAVYQRALEDFPSPRITTVADVIFGFSNDSRNVVRNSGSRVSYHVVTGYIGDHRAPLLRHSAHAIREALRAKGAKKIVAFFDENASDDDRWHVGYKFFQDNYAFLLEKVLKYPWLGLVIKPKGPLVLRHRLGPVAELLERAEHTGRCQVIGEGIVHGSTPPVHAALSADVVIHGHLCAGTAGFESALAGVPTLLLDLEGWHISPLYQLGVGRVVFRRWDDLWTTFMEHIDDPKKVPGFGDWSSMLDTMDPFRDGRAAERMGAYLQWMIEGLKQGKDRDIVLASVAERYAAKWGADKVYKAK